MIPQNELHPIWSHPQYIIVQGNQVLHLGNPNLHLSYHWSWIDFETDTVVRCDLRKDAEQHLARWLRQTEGQRRGKKPRIVRVNFYWRTFTRTRARATQEAPGEV